MTTPSVNTSADELLQEWLAKAWLRRMFLPGDFQEQVAAAGDGKHGLPQGHHWNTC